MAEILNCLRRTMALAVLVPASALAAEPAPRYPVKPIRMVVPFSPGSASDFLSRTIGQKLGEAVGQQIVVDNRPGAGGVVAAVMVANAAPDGYTLMLMAPPLIVNAIIHQPEPYRPLDDFTPITQIASLPNLLVVPTAFAAKSVKELVAMAKSKPGDLNFGSAGIGSLSHLSGELFKSAAAINVVHIPFKLFSDALGEMYAGRVHFYVSPISAVMPGVKDGRLRALAVTTRKRAAQLPEVPTMAEAGLPEFQFDAWFGVAGPAKLPAALVARLNTIIGEVVRSPDIGERFARQGVEPVTGTAQEFAQLVRADYAKYRKLIPEANIKVQ
jgi:tripartite-type tricarboxylate transporter receptor subunit TctC